MVIKILAAAALFVFGWPLTCSLGLKMASGWQSSLISQASLIVVNTLRNNNEANQAIEEMIAATSTGASDSMPLEMRKLHLYDAAQTTQRKGSSPSNLIGQLNNSVIVSWQLWSSVEDYLNRPSMFSFESKLPAADLLSSAFSIYLTETEECSHCQVPWERLQPGDAPLLGHFSAPGHLLSTHAFLATNYIDLGLAESSDILRYAVAQPLSSSFDKLDVKYLALNADVTHLWEMYASEQSYTSSVKGLQSVGVPEPSIISWYRIVAIVSQCEECNTRRVHELMPSPTICADNHCTKPNTSPQVSETLTPTSGRQDTSHSKGTNTKRTMLSSRSKFHAKRLLDVLELYERELIDVEEKITLNPTFGTPQQARASAMNTVPAIYGPYLQKDNVASRLQNTIALIFLEFGRINSLEMLQQLHALTRVLFAVISTALEGPDNKGKWAKKPVQQNKQSDAKGVYKLIKSVFATDSKDGPILDEETAYFRINMYSLYFLYIRVSTSDQAMIQKIGQDDIKMMFDAVFLMEPRHIIARFLRLPFLSSIEPSNPNLRQDVVILQSILLGTANNDHSNPYTIPVSHPLLNLMNPLVNEEPWVQLANYLSHFGMLSQGVEVVQTALSTLYSDDSVGSDQDDDGDEEDYDDFGDGEIDDDDDEIGDDEDEKIGNDEYEDEDEDEDDDDDIVATGGDIATSKRRSQLWGIIGSLSKKLGDFNLGNHSCSMTIKYDPRNIEAYMNRASLFLEAGYWELALKDLEKASTVDPSFQLAHGTMGLLLQNRGKFVDAIKVLSRCLSIEKGTGDRNQCLLLKAVTLHSSGRFEEALQSFEELDKNSGGSYESTFPRRELAAYHYLHLDVNLQLFHLDRDFDEGMKQEHSRRQSTHRTNRTPYSAKAKKLLKASRQVQGTFQQLNPVGLNGSMPICDVHKEKGVTSTCLISCAKQNDIEEAVRATKEIATWLQLNSTGFIPHEGKQRAFGLSVLHIAQEIRTHGDVILLFKRMNDGVGSVVFDSGASKVNTSTGVPCGKQLMEVKRSTKCHQFGWRDIGDIATRWRALAETMDTIWYFDLLPEFTNEGEKVPPSLNTHIVKRGSKIHRYYNYYDKAFNSTVRELVKRGSAYGMGDVSIKLSKDDVERIKQASSLDDLYAAVGSQPFYVFVSCDGVKHKNLMGIRLSLTGTPAEGFNFGIDTPLSISRYREYSDELTAVFDALVVELVALFREDTPQRHDTVLNLALKFFYYWINLTPITRGASAVGYAILYGSVLAAGDEISERVAYGLQLDWEAMLAPSVQEFVDAMWPWISNRHPSALLKPKSGHLELPYLDSPKDYRERAHLATFMVEDPCKGETAAYTSCPAFCRKHLSRVFPTMRAILTGTNFEGA